MLPQLYEAYAKYVAANNAIAAQYNGKYANFMDYSYANDYGREYTPEDVATMRNLVRTKIAPALIKIYGQIRNAKGFYDSNYNFYAGMEDDYDFYAALSFESLFTPDEDYPQGAYDAVNYIGNYFKYLNNGKTGDDAIDFYGEVNKLFKNGNYFTSDNGEEGAYTYYIQNKNTPIMYFDDSYDSYYGYSYSTAFTFVHEFGHYYADVYSAGADFSMDHAETHSQGDEMMFLAWLASNCPKGAEYGYKLLQAYQLYNILNTIVQATIVDEFEQAVYSNTYGEGEFKNGIQSAAYAKRYKAILDSYGTGMSDLLGEDYWTYVVVDNSAYYISYAMSALPSLELFVKATSNLDTAREAYFKLFTCVYDEASDADSDGEVTYSEALAYAGLDSPFSQSMYDAISQYFANYSI